MKERRELVIVALYSLDRSLCSCAEVSVLVLVWLSSFSRQHVKGTDRGALSERGARRGTGSRVVDNDSTPSPVAVATNETLTYIKGIPEKALNFGIR